MEEANFSIKMRFIGYYMSEDQFMRTEEIFPEEAEKLSLLLRKTYESFIRNKYVDNKMLEVLNGNTVFILKGENGHLYGYYPKYNIARITNVRYVKPNVSPMPYKYKKWFYPGDRLFFNRTEETDSQL